VSLRAFNYWLESTPLESNRHDERDRQKDQTPCAQAACQSASRSYRRTHLQAGRCHGPDELASHARALESAQHRLAAVECSRERAAFAGERDQPQGAVGSGVGEPLGSALEASKLLALSNDPGDSRLTLVSLTQRGREILEESRPYAEWSEKVLLEGVDEVKLESLLDRLEANTQGLIDALECYPVSVPKRK
jgi:hypothetical protein